MRQQKIAPAPGHPAFAHGQGAYPLPPDLAHGERILVLEREGSDVIVQDLVGRRWRLAHWQVDAGSLYELEPGHWLPAHDARVRARLSELVERPGSAGSDAAAAIAEELERWG